MVNNTLTGNFMLFEGLRIIIIIKKRLTNKKQEKSGSGLSLNSTKVISFLFIVFIY